MQRQHAAAVACEARARLGTRVARLGARVLFRTRRSPLAGAARTGGSDVQQRSFRVATSAARSSVGLIRVVLLPDGSEPRDEECAATISRHEAAVLLRQPFQVHKPPLLLLDGCHVREREAWAHVGAVLGNGRQMQWNGALERASLRFETCRTHH